ERAKLIRLAHDGAGLVAVRSDGCTGEVVEGCKLRGTYRLRRYEGSRSETRTSGAGPAVELVAVGELSVGPDFALTAEGACDRAPHAVAGVQVGAFRVAGGGPACGDLSACASANAACAQPISAVLLPLGSKPPVVQVPCSTGHTRVNGACIVAYPEVEAE